MRRQLPAYSPLTVRGVAKATAAALLDRGRAAEARLREALAERYEAERVVLTGSATQALQLAFRAAVDAGGDPRRPVALPAYSCYDLVSAAVGAEVRVVFYDVDPASLTPEPAGLAAALERSPAALLANGLFGFPLDWTALRQAADSVGAVLIEDAAQGLGASWGGRPAGVFGDVTVLSFGRGKGWTGGAGGALLERGAVLHVPDPGPPPRRGGPRAFARLGAQLALGHPWTFWIAAALPGVTLGETVYEEPTPPHRPGSFVAAAVEAHMAAAAAAVADRASVAADWRTILGGTDRAELRFCGPLAGVDCGWLRAPVLASGYARSRLASTGAARWGVGRGYPLALPRLPQARPILAPGGPTPGAEALAEALFTLPTHQRVGPDDQEGVRTLLDARK